MAYKTQPGAAPPPPGAPVQWMESIPLIPNCPPGLEYLTQIDRIIVEKKVSLLEASTESEVKNKYAIYNESGQQVYLAFQETFNWSRNCGGENPGFSTYMVDNFQRQVMRVFIPTRLPGSCLGPNETIIEAPVASRIGIVRQEGCCCNMHLSICAADGNSQLLIESPNVGSLVSFCGQYPDWVFKIKTLDGAEIGEIRWKYMGYLNETSTDIHNFTVNFPMDLDVRTKATLIGATFLIVEATWGAMKASIRHLRGTTKDRLSTYLLEYMFRRATEKGQLFQHLLVRMEAAYSLS